MVAFYRHDIPGWMDGTEALGHLEYRAYHVICQLIYLNDGPIILNEIGIAGRCAMRLDHFRRALAGLVRSGKVQVADGVVFNDRCGRELEQMEQNRKNGAKGGRASTRRKKPAPTHELPSTYSPPTHELPSTYSPPTHELPSTYSPPTHELPSTYSPPTHELPENNALKNNDTLQASLIEDVSLKEKIREEERIESGAQQAAPPPAPADDPSFQDTPGLSPASVPADMPDDGGDARGSLEDQYWHRVGSVVGATKVARSRFGQLANLLNGDFERGLVILDAVSKAKAPSAYLGAIIRDMGSEASGAPPPKRVKGEPDWVTRRRSEGAFVEREGPNRWRDCGVLHDDAGREVGW